MLDATFCGSPQTGEYSMHASNHKAGKLNLVLPTAALFGCSALLDSS